jgi:ketosteroid isomerase-like protein
VTSDHVERVRRGYDALNRTGAPESILDELDPDIEIVIPADAVDYAGVVLRGHQGMVDALRALAEAWSETTFEPREFIDGGDRVLAICCQRSRGLHTNLEFEQIVAHLWHVGKDGKLTRLELSFDPEQARKKLLESRRRE